MELRPYQQKAIELLRNSLRAGKRLPVLQMSTGAGKTVVAGEIIKSAVSRGKKVAFIVDRLTLIDQASRHLHAIGVDHGIIQASHPMTDYAKPVQVVSAQTMARRYPWEFDLAIIDECHIVFKAHAKLMQTWNNIPFIGLSATPYTKGLGNVYDDLIVPITIHELIDEGYLVDADIYGPSKPNMKGVKTVGDDFNQKQAAERSMDQKLIASITDTWEKLAEGRQTICFATNVIHSKTIVERFQSIGVNAQHIDAYTNTDNRKEIIEQFKTGEVKLLSSVGVLTTGFDAPNAEYGILARPTKSLSLHIQMIGRLLRPFEGKRAIIADHAGNFERLGFHTDELPTVLDKHKKGEKKQPEPKKPLPKPCKACGFMKPPKVHQCPKCGFAPQKQNDIEEEAGELKQLKNKKITKEEKQKIYSELLGYAKKHQYKSGWASHKYKKLTGVWPKGLIELPKDPSANIINFIKHEAIKYAYSKKKTKPSHRANI